MTDYDPILQEIEAQGRRRRQDVRTLIMESGHPDAAAILLQFEQNMRDVDTGIGGARSTWHSISLAQRRVLEALETRWYLMRASGSRTRYDAHGEPHAEGNVCGIATVRNLIRRELLAVDGGAFDPEKKIVLTERGRFVLKHGRSP